MVKWINRFNTHPNLIQSHICALLLPFFAISVDYALPSNFMVFHSYPLL